MSRLAPAPDREQAIRRSTRRDLLVLAAPIAAAMLGDTGIALVDTKLVAVLGARALGGVGVATVLTFLVYALVFGLMRGVKVRTAYAHGQRRPEDGLRYAQGGVLIGLAAGLVVWLLARDATFVLEALRVDPGIIPYARDFLASRTMAAPATCAMAAMIQHRQGAGDARTPMLVGLFGNVVNAVLAFALIHGHFGLPALGVTGAGYGTALTETLAAVALGLLLLRDVRRGRGSPSRIPLRSAVREVAELGIPTGVHFGLEAMAFTTFTAVIAGLGAEEVAAHHIALCIIRASFLPGIAVGEAVSVLVGNALGERDLARADRVTRAGVTLAAGFMSLCGVGFAIFGGAIAGLFTTDPAVVTIARRLLLVAAVFQTLDAVYMVLRGALRGAKDVRWVAVVGTSICWVAIPGSAYVFGTVLGLGALGGWLGFILETTIGAALLWHRWRSGAWRLQHAGAPASDSHGGSIALAAAA